ncbi:MAG: hypothetical protein WD269_09145 [Acidimicrobiia bacterium]
MADLDWLAETDFASLIGLAASTRFQPADGWVDFVSASDGSYVIHFGYGARGPCETVYSARSLTFVSYCQGVGEEEQDHLVMATGLPPGGIEGRERDLFWIGSNAFLSDGLYVRLREHAQGRALQGVVRVSYDVSRGGEMSTSGTFAADVELKSGLPLLIERSAAGEDQTNTSSWVLTSAEPVGEMPDFEVMVQKLMDSSNVEPTRLDYGFKQVSEGDLLGLVSYTPLYLNTVTSSPLELTGIYFAEETIVPEGIGNPVSSQVLVFAYRNGLDTVIVTNRKGNVTVGGPESEGIPIREATAEDWSDPFNVAGWTNQVVEVPIEAEYFESVIADLTVVPHAWASIGDAVVTIEGNVAPYVLDAFAIELGATAASR